MNNNMLNILKFINQLSNALLRFFYTVFFMGVIVVILIFLAFKAGNFTGAGKFKKENQALRTQLLTANQGKANAEQNLAAFNVLLKEQTALANGLNNQLIKERKDHKNTRGLHLAAVKERDHFEIAFVRADGEAQVQAALALHRQDSLREERALLVKAEEFNESQAIALEKVRAMMENESKMRRVAEDNVLDQAGIRQLNGGSKAYFAFGTLFLLWANARQRAGLTVIPVEWAKQLPFL